MTVVIGPNGIVDARKGPWPTIPFPLEIEVPAAYYSKHANVLEVTCKSYATQRTDDPRPLPAAESKPFYFALSASAAVSQ